MFNEVSISRYYKKKNSLIKTSEFSDQFIREDQEGEKALEANKEEIKLFTSSNDEVSSLSIASLNFKKSENIEEEDHICLLYTSDAADE